MTEECLQELENQQQSPEQQKQFEYITELEKSKQEVFELLSNYPKQWQKEISKIVKTDFEELLKEYRRISSDQAEKERFCNRFNMSQKKFETIGIIEFGKKLGKLNEISLPRMRRQSTRYLINDNFSNNVLPLALNTEEPIVIDEYRVHRKAPLTKYIISTADNTPLNQKQIYEYGRAVLDTVATLYESESYIYTLSSLYKAMVHDTSGRTVNESQLKPLWEQLLKLFRTEINVNGLNGHAIEMKWFNVKTKEKCNPFPDDLNKIALIIKEPPLLYQNAGKQIIPVKPELLQIMKVKEGNLTTSRESETPQRIAIKNYLLRRISNLNSGNMDNECIKIDTVLHESIGEDELTRLEIKRHRDYILTVLENWKQSKFIQGYEVTKQGSGSNAKITGFKINPKMIEG